MKNMNFDQVPVPERKYEFAKNNTAEQLRAVGQEKLLDVLEEWASKSPGRSYVADCSDGVTGSTVNLSWETGEKYPTFSHYDVKRGGIAVYTEPKPVIITKQIVWIGPGESWPDPSSIVFPDNEK